MIDLLKKAKDYLFKNGLKTKRGLILVGAGTVLKMLAPRLPYVPSDSEIEVVVDASIAILDYGAQIVQLFGLILTSWGMIHKVYKKFLGQPTVS